MTSPQTDRPLSTEPQLPLDLPPSCTIDERGLATITLRRPSKMNRLTPGDLLVLQEHFNTIDAEPQVRLVLITALTQGQSGPSNPGSPAKRPVFCAGYDVSGFDAADYDPRIFEITVDRLAELRPIVIAAMPGSVYGGATDLAFACDLRLALAGSEFRMPACALGLHYYPSGLKRYLAVMGLNGAKQAFLTAQALPVERLCAQGVLLATPDAEHWQSTVDALITQTLSLAPLAAQLTKASLNDLALGRDQLANLRTREATTLESEDFAEGRRAFAQRRPPVFQGR